MNKKSLLVGCLFVAAACAKGAKEQEVHDKAKPQETVAAPADAVVAADPACAAKVKDFETWLTSLEVERSSYEIDFGYKLQPIDREPSPIEQEIDAVMITPTSLEAFDATESNHAESKLGKNPAQKAVVDRLTTIHGMADKTPDRLRLDIDEKATWGDVARVAEAAQKAGYQEAVFAFTAKSKLVPPPGAEEWTTKQEDVDAASKKIEDLSKPCPAWDGAILRHVPKPSRLENAQAMASEIAAAIQKCNCAVNLDEVKTQMFKEARWHHAVPRVGVVVPVAGVAAIKQPAKTPWSQAYEKVAALAK